MASPFPPAPQPGAVPPQQSPLQRLQWAVGRREETDYIFDFWTAIGWSVLTCGIYGLYVFYRLFWRSVEHNKRRIELLDAAVALAWERATAEGRGDELTPRFEAVSTHLNAMRRLAGEFRDPAIWTILAVVASGIAQIVGYVFLDRDLVAHEAADAAAEAELAAIYAALGSPVDLPPATPPKGPHNWVSRVVVTVLTCGIYGFWWLYDLMTEGNEHQRGSWVSDDAWWSAASALAAR